MVEDLSEVEVRDAARSMTLKYGLLGLPQGGAKAGITADPTAPWSERRERLLEFGRAIEPMLRERAYIPDADMGTKAQEIRWMLQTLGAPVFSREWRDNESGRWTASSVLGAARAALGYLGESSAGKSVAIEGFGAVGYAVAILFAESGARVVAISTSQGAIHDPGGLNVDRLIMLAESVGHHVVEHYPAQRIPRDSLRELAVDILSPCARRHSIHVGNASTVKARLICPGANNPVSPEAEAVLLQRGVMSLPDFLCNCGGVLGGTMAFASISRPRIARFIEESVQKIMAKLLAASERTGVPLRTHAERLAQDRFDRIRAAAAQAGMGAKLFEVALDAYRRGWIPGWASAVVSPRYFDRALGL